MITLLNGKHSTVEKQKRPLRSTIHGRKLSVVTYRVADCETR